MKQCSILRTMLMSATTIGTVGSLSAYAEQATTLAAANVAAEAEADLTQDVIIVTGTRRALSIQDVPINITALSGEDIAKERIDDIRDLAAFTPGLAVLDTGPRSSGSIILRGLGADDTGSFGSNADNALATYLGEVPLYLDFKLIDIERVETLLGPQGTLYGLGTLAGAIRYIPERPNAESIEGYAHFRTAYTEHSDDLSFVGDGAINIPIIEDKLAFRTTLGIYDEAGFIDYTRLLKEPGVSLPQQFGADYSLGSAEFIEENTRVDQDVNYEKTITSRNQLGFYPTEWLDLNLTYAYQKTETGGRQAVGDPIFGLGDYDAPWRYLEPSTRESQLFALEANVEVGSFAKMVATIARTEATVDSSADVTDLLLDLDYDYELFPAFSGYTDSDQEREQLNAEVRFVSDHGGPISWVIGGFYNELKLDSTYFEILPGIESAGDYIPWLAGLYRPDEIEYASFVDSTTEEVAAFGEATYQITDKFQITAGARYFEYTAEVEGGQALPLWQDYPEINFRSRAGDTSDDGVVWKFNSSYNITDDVMVYGTYSKGYRIGGVNRVAPCVLPLPAGQNLCALPDELSYGPDETINKELGIRTTTFDGKLIFNMAVFQIDWEGIQLAGQTVNGAIGITVNGAEALSEGFEMSFKAEPIDHLVFTGSFGYTDATLTADVPGLLQDRPNGKVDVLAGDRLPGSPKESGALGVSYMVPLESGADISMRWTAAYTGDVLTRVGARAFGETLPAYTTHNAAITYDKDAWSFSLFASNLFDEYAITSVGNDLSRTFINDDVASRYYARNVLTPRRIGLETKYRF